MDWQFRFEPAVWLGLIRAGLSLGMAFGLDWTAEQVAVTMLFTEAVLTVIQRSVVTPNARM